MNPINRNENTVVVEECSSDSGIKCKNAPPNNAPADKATKNDNIFFKVFFLRDIVIIPINEIKLTNNVANNIQIKVFILSV